VTDLIYSSLPLMYIDQMNLAFTKRFPHAKQKAWKVQVCSSFLYEPRKDICAITSGDYVVTGIFCDGVLDNLTIWREGHCYFSG
jgi:hypothetical protein